jgi:16S rRNA (guanine527-N7)-methyltransferase
VTGDVLERWLGDVVATRGLTALRSVEEARRFLLDDVLRALQIVEATPGPIVDVGSGGGSPGIPLAAALPDRRVTLLESQRKKCDFLSRYAGELPNLEVVWGRAEEQPTDAFGVALAKALAKPPVACELCVPLVRVGGVAVLWTGESADAGSVAAVAAKLGAELEDERGGLLVIRKTSATPDGFPRRPGMAKKRPLA